MLKHTALSTKAFFSFVAIGIVAIGIFIPHSVFAVESQIIYSDSGNIWKINADGTGNTKLTTDNASSWGSMTSDLTKVVYGNYGAGNPNGNIYIMNADGTGQTDLTNATDESESSPAISANSAKIIYTRQDDDNRDIYIMNANGTGQTRLTTNVAEDNWASISPDTTKIAFTSARDGGTYQVYIMNADGSGQTELTSGVDRAEYPTFSPDGTKIAFEKNGILYTMNIDGTNQTAISSGGVQVSGTVPSYNAAGTKIAFMGDDGLYVMNVDGSGKTRVLDHGLYPHFSLFQPIILDDTPPVFTADATAGSVTADGATIAWTTDEAASTQVTYGLTSSYGSSTSTTDTSPTVTSHSVTLSGLLSCTTYHYAAVTTDDSSNTATSDDATFTTTCSGGAEPSSETSSSVTVSSPSTIALPDNGRTFTVETPADFTSASSSVVIQIKGLDSGTVLGSIGKPSSSLTSGASIVFDVTALIDSTTVLDSFDAPVTISYAYTDADIAGLDESSLSMYHYHDGAWLPLDSCSVNAPANTITCNAPSFSTFAIFGTPQPAPAARASSPGGAVIVWPSSASISGGGNTGNLSFSTTTTVKLCPYYGFSRQLRLGNKGQDVLALQKFLNCAGFSLGSSGPGSLGNETMNFSDRTLNSVKAFQKAYSSDILVPIGTAVPTGIFAIYSEKKAYSLMVPQ